VSNDGQAGKSSSFEGYAMAIEFGVILIPLYLLTDPWHSRLAVSMPVAAGLFFAFAAIVRALEDGNSLIMGLLMAAPLWILVAPAILVINTYEQFLRTDIPMMAAASAAALLGSLVAGAFKRSDRVIQ